MSKRGCEDGGESSSCGVLPTKRQKVGGKFDSGEPDMDMDELAALEEEMMMEDAGEEYDMMVDEADDGEDEDDGSSSKILLAAEPEEVLGSEQKHGWGWARNPAKPLDPSSQSLVFQQLDVDYSTIHGNTEPVVRIFGVTEEGNSVYVKVFGVEPYFYIQAPPGMQESDIPSLVEALNSTARSAGKPQLVKRIAFVMKTNIYGYHPDPEPFLRITTFVPGNVTPLRDIISGKGFFWNGRNWNLPTFESKIQFNLRFMVDKDIVGANWLELPAGTFELVQSRFKESTCQYEAEIREADLISHPTEGPYSRLSPARILSFDIECGGKEGFPIPERDPVIQIANYVVQQGSSKPLVKNVFTLGSCASIPGADVHSFETESAMLLAWREFVQTVDPDIITGYNIVGFDIDYLMRRARALRIDSEFGVLSKLRLHVCTIQKSQFASKAYGTQETKAINAFGRVFVDMLQVMQREHKLSSYSLNSVSVHFLGEQKEDVDYSIINDLQEGNAETRRRLAVYCLKDAYLPIRLVEKLMVIYNFTEMARVTGVPLAMLLKQGQQIKVMSQLLRHCKKLNYVIPVLQKGISSGESYEGAIVLNAVKGFYPNPISVLDFASLYPSIMMQHNLCYSTLLLPGRGHLVKEELKERTPNGDYFVRSEVRKGVLPEILRSLLQARARAREEIKHATDPMVKAVLNGRQLALKVSANSVYGFTGATIGMLPCLAISSSVTAFGREMIEATKDFVELKYSREERAKRPDGLHEPDSEECMVIYGDTDSVMIRLGLKSLEMSMKLGQEAARRVTRFFQYHFNTAEGIHRMMTRSRRGETEVPNWDFDFEAGMSAQLDEELQNKETPIRLEFEKAYSPYLLISKKRYAGILHTDPHQKGYLDQKGLETVRRDNCALTRMVLQKSLELILMERDVEGAKEFVKRTISDLLQDRVDTSLLVITKQYSKKEYKAKVAHVELAKRMSKRDPGTAPKLGDRVPYVIVRKGKGVPNYEKAEDPIYAVENNIPIDTNYYLDGQLSKPLIRIFRSLMSNPQSLLDGEHTRTITIRAPTKGGIMNFAKKTLTCLSCKAPLPAGEVTLCKFCKSKEAEVYSKAVCAVAEKEELFSQLWTQCQRCQHSLHQDVLCTSRDCPIFYMRKKVQKDLLDSQEELRRFDW